MTPKKCMSIAKSLTDTQHMELEPLCNAPFKAPYIFSDFHTTMQADV